MFEDSWEGLRLTLEPARPFQKYPVPEIIDPVFAKTSQNSRFLLSENERFGLVFVKTGSINSGTGVFTNKFCFQLLFFHILVT
jgi:hypothetical protein